MPTQRRTYCPVYLDSMLSIHRVFYETKIWTSPASLSDAFRCLPAAFAANSLLRASSRAFAASDFTAVSRPCPDLDFGVSVHIFTHVYFYTFHIKVTFCSTLPLLNVSLLAFIVRSSSKMSNEFALTYRAPRDSMVQSLN